jgi:hypothetical protein
MAQRITSLGVQALVSPTNDVVITSSGVQLLRTSSFSNGDPVFISALGVQVVYPFVDEETTTKRRRVYAVVGG